jgi:solute carrier family 35 protein F5
MGFFNMLFLWPLIAIVSAAKIEQFVLPTGMLIVYLLVNSLFGTTLSDYLWLLAVLLLSPVIATVGLSMTIPVAMISDMIIQSTSFSGIYILGSILVAIGFVVVNLHEDVDTRLKKLLCKR